MVIWIYCRYSIFDSSVTLLGNAQRRRVVVEGHFCLDS